MSELIDFTEIEAVLNDGITEIYRTAIGNAITAIAAYRNNSTDPDSFDAAIQYLREHSAGIKLGDRP